MPLNQPGSALPAAPITGWTVTAQQQIVTIGPDGSPQQGVKVSFITGKGVSSSVFLSEAQYNPANVRAAIAAKADQVDQIQGMSG